MRLQNVFIFICCVAQWTLFGDEWNTVYLASFPRSGNHWVRFLVEEATSIATSSVYRDRDYPHLLDCFPWGGYCVEHGYSGECRYPMADDPVLLKTHYPFLPRMIEPTPERAIVLIRHPIDSFRSFYLYRGGDEQSQIDESQLAEFIQGWRMFYEFWESQSNVVFVRYEDLQEDTARYLSVILEAAGFSFTQSDIDRAVVKYRAYGSMLKHFGYYENELIEKIRLELSDMLTRFGYDM